VTAYADIIGAISPIAEMVVRFSTSAFTLSLFFTAAIDMMCPVGINILQVTISQSLAAKMTGQLVVKAKNRLTGSAMSRPVRYSRFILLVLSVMMPAGRDRSTRISSPMLLSRLTSVMLAPRVRK